MTDETRARFLTAIAAQLPIERIVEIHECVVVTPVIEASTATRRRKPKR